MKPVVYSNWRPWRNSAHSCAYVVNGRWESANCNDLGKPLCELSLPEEDLIFPNKRPPSPTIDDLISQELCIVVNDEKLCMRFVKLQLNFASASDFCANRLNLKWSGSRLPSGKNVTNAVIKLMDEASADQMRQAVRFRI